MVKVSALYLLEVICWEGLVHRSMEMDTRTVRKPSVLLLKAMKDGDVKDAYVQELENANFSVECLPVLDFSFVNQTELASHLRTPSNFAGIVLTSPRALEAILATLDDQLFVAEWNSTLRCEWSQKPAFVVGKATACSATALGFATVGEETGSAEKLAPLVLERLTGCGQTKPLLFPCSSLKRETLPTALRKAGIKVQCLTVYETSADPNIKEGLKHLLQETGPPEFVVFFSPSGVNFTEPHLRTLDVTTADLKCVPIGRTTEAELRRKDLPVHATCCQPTPEHLLKALLRDG